MSSPQQQKMDMPPLRYTGTKNWFCRIDIPFYQRNAGKGITKNTRSQQPGHASPNDNCMLVTLMSRCIHSNPLVSIHVAYHYKTASNAAGSRLAKAHGWACYMAQVP